MPTIEVPAGLIAQVAFAFREKANEYHGALARYPNDAAASAWREQAHWFDAQADALRDAVSDEAIKPR